MATLHITAGNEKGRSFPISGNELRVGRGTDQDVVLTDVSASRKHFAIVKDGTRWKVVDQGSGNGTLLNGVKVPSAHLKDGDVIEIGQTAFRFEEKAPKPVMAPSQARPLAQSGTPSSGAMAPVPSSGGIGTGAKVLLYGMMFLLSAGSIGVILTRTVLAKPVVIQSDADLVFKQGLRFFAAGEYESAKSSFTDAAKSAPDSAAVKRYLGLCDTEAANKEKLKAGEKFLNAHRYDEAKKQLENVESSSVHYDKAQSLLRSAKQHDGETVVASAPAPAPTAAAAPTPPPAAPEKADKADKNVKVAKVDTSSKSSKDDKMKPVNVMKSNPAPTPVVEEKPAKGEAAPDSKAAMTAYKARDFAGAVRAYRQEAMGAKDGASAQKLIAAAKQVEQIKDLLERAATEEKSAPDKAVKTYEEAMAADQKISKGVHAAYIKGKIGGMSLQTAKQAFTNGKYDQAFQLAMSAQKAGASDAGALLKQLDQKASEMLAKAQSQVKSNPTEAKNIARQVQKMVPSGSQNYVKAYQLINSSGAPRRDEDE